MALNTGHAGATSRVAAAKIARRLTAFTFASAGPPIKRHPRCGRLATRGGASQGGQFFTTSSEPGPVEVAVETELGGLTDARPGLAEAALAMARILDNARAVNQQPAAAKVLVALLDRLHSASGQNRRGGLASVRAMSSRSLDT
jgi:hypothetical protein